VAHHKSAIKRIRQNERRRVRNKGIRSRTRPLSKNVIEALGDGDNEAAKAALKQAIPAIDKAAAKGIIKKNTASRKISRLMKKVGQVKA
jgi:small subunit ribosomal protein S20